jgi:hypothetical protein
LGHKEERTTHLQFEAGGGNNGMGAHEQQASVQAAGGFTVFRAVSIK